MAGALTADGRRLRDDQLAVVACETCPRVFTVRARRLREITAGRAPAMCESCRKDAGSAGGRPAEGHVPGGQLVVDDAMRAFWADQFSLAELVEMATAAWGPPGSWGREWRHGFVFVGSEVIAA